MVRAYVALGSNVGDRRAALEGALGALAALEGTRVCARSRFHETAAVGGPADQGDFLNGACELETSLEAGALLERLQRIEGELGRPGREQRQRWGPRVLDLDLLFYGEWVFDRPGLRVPHPRLHERWFVLKPLSEIAPRLMHPTRGQSVEQMLRELEAEGSEEARRYEGT